MPDKRLRRKPLIPLYAVCTFLAMLSVQLICYYLTKLVLPSLTPHLLTSSLDERIPFSPPWVTVYFISFPFWICSVFLILCESKPHAYRIGCAYIFAMLLSAGIFLIYPCTMKRPEITGGGFFDEWMRFLYRIDSPNNLCPSLHVVITYFCWRGSMNCRNIPRWYKTLAFVFLIAVCFSILLIKQHVFIDIPCAILVGEFALQFVRLCRIERIPYAVERHFLRKRP